MPRAAMPTKRWSRARSQAVVYLPPPNAGCSFTWSGIGRAAAIAVW